MVDGREKGRRRLGLRKKTTWGQNLPLTNELCDLETYPLCLGFFTCKMGIMCLLCVGMRSQRTGYEALV